MTPKNAITPNGRAQIERLAQQTKRTYAQAWAYAGHEHRSNWADSLALSFVASQDDDFVCTAGYLHEVRTTFRKVMGVDP